LNPLDLVRGFPGKPSHPPLTDASIGAYTAGVAMLVLGVAALLLLTAGGYMGGSLVFVYGIRVLKRRDTPVSDALIPGRSNDPDDAGERPVIQDRPAVRS
jgi:hypothetical protein